MEDDEHADARSQASASSDEALMAHASQELPEGLEMQVGVTMNMLMVPTYLCLILRACWPVKAAEASIEWYLTQFAPVTGISG